MSGTKITDDDRAVAERDKAAGMALVKTQTLEEALMLQAGQENVLEAYKLARQAERMTVLRKATAEMARLSWGQNLSDATRFAISRWALENDVDPLRHLDVLGNNLYANARYYYDKVADSGLLREEEVIVLAPLVSTDFSKLPVSKEQAVELKMQAEAINAERLALQMRLGVPEVINAHGDKAAAALVRLYWTDGSITEGVNWAGKYGQKKGDPVGEDHPVKTAITRAFRKAAMKKVSVHKFAKGDEGSPLATVGAYIDGDRHERHKNAENEKRLNLWRGTKTADNPYDASPTDTERPVEAGTEDNHAAPTLDEDAMRQEELGMAEG